MPDESIDPRSQAVGIYKSKMKDALRQLKDAQDRISSLENDLGTARAETVNARTKYDESPLKTENDSLKGQVREMRHWTAIERHLRDGGIRPDAIESFRKSVSYEVKADQPDDEAIKAMVPDWKAKHPYFFAEDKGTETPTPTPAPGRGQGGRDGNNGKLRVTMQQVGDDAWVYAHQKEYQQAIKDGTLEIVS